MQSAPDGEIKPSVVRGVGAREGARSGGTSRMQSGGSGGRGGLKGEEGVQVAWRSGEQRNGGRPNGAGVEHWSPRSPERAEGRECNCYGPPGFFLFFPFLSFCLFVFYQKKAAVLATEGGRQQVGEDRAPPAARSLPCCSLSPLPALAPARLHPPERDCRPPRLLSILPLSL